MKTTSLQPYLLNLHRVPRILPGLLMTAAVTFPCHDVLATPLDLGTASDFAVLAGAGITVAGAVNSTTITGDIGSYPTTSLTGLGNVVLNGVNQTPNSSLMLSAQNDLTTAFTEASGLSATVSYTPGFDLGGQTLTPGVYLDPSSFGLTGVLTLDAQGDPNAVFIIQAGTSLTTAADSSVRLINGAQSVRVDWVVGTSATLGAGSDFAGSLLASTFIAADTGATVQGQLLAENGAVTLDNDTITESAASAPEPGNILGGCLLLVPAGAIALRKLRQPRMLSRNR